MLATAALCFILLRFRAPVLDVTNSSSAFRKSKGEIGTAFPSPGPETAAAQLIVAHLLLAQRHQPSFRQTGSLKAVFERFVRPVLYHSDLSNFETRSQAWSDFDETREDKAGVRLKELDAILSYFGGFSAGAESSVSVQELVFERLGTSLGRDATAPTLSSTESVSMTTIQSEGPGVGEGADPASGPPVSTTKAFQVEFLHLLVVFSRIYSEDFKQQVQNQMHQSQTETLMESSTQSDTVEISNRTTDSVNIEEGTRAGATAKRPFKKWGANPTRHPTRRKKLKSALK